MVGRRRELRHLYVWKIAAGIYAALISGWVAGLRDESDQIVAIGCTKEWWDPFCEQSVNNSLPNTG